MPASDPLVNEFLVESYENLDQLDRDLVALEQDPRDRGRLGSIFRTIHTIKGTCGFFGYDKLGAVAHVGENLLCRLRDGELVLTPESATALLALVDAVRGILTRIEAAGDEGDGDYTELIATLTRLTDAEATEPSLPSPPGGEGGSRSEPGEGSGGEDDPLTRRPAAGCPLPQGARAEDVPPAPEPPPSHAEHHRPEPAAPAAKAPASAADHAPAAAVADANVRVDVGLLDKLMTLVGELVLARNQILQYAPAQKDPGLVGTAQRLNLITSELQEGVMKTRMQPIGTVWNRFPRVVRDLAAACGKQIRVEMQGQETELDRTIIEAIKDPLTHVVRNSVDHGVEPPEVRAAAGKPAEGRLLLRAYHEGGQVIIEITDDGGGVRPDKVRAKAISRGLLDPDRAARMTDRELTQLIFLPGFSTAEAVTSISGRGVGMDVVKTNIEKIGGTVDLQSRVGDGTTLKVKIPLTLAIIPALLVTCGGDRYAIPQNSLLELVRLDGDAARGRVESFHGAPVYRLRGHLLPLVYLSRLLGVDPRPVGDGVTIVVLRADDRAFGLVVDGVLDTEEIVVKPLGKMLGHLPVFAGATIMGDGRVALILDVPGVAHHGKVTVPRDRAAEAAADAARAAQADRQSLLLVGLGADRRLAVPLGRVARLEEFPADSVEWADGQEVVRYRGDILPLFRVADLLGGFGGAADGDALKVIVATDAGRTVGLVVGKILDAVEAAVDVRRGPRRPGLSGSAVIQDRVTDLVDIPALLALADPVGV